MKELINRMFEEHDVVRRQINGIATNALMENRELKARLKAQERKGG